VSDPILARQLQAMAFLLVGMSLIGLALYLRLRVFIGNQPGGVDTWYYLASAEAIRRQKWLPISLPQYLLHDRHESYPAVFPIFLALLPRAWLRSYFWLVSPVVDSLQLLLLYLLAFRLTDSVLAAGTAGLIYAVTPQLISETRNLNGRAFASLLQTLAMITLLRSIIPEDALGPGLFDPVAPALFWVAVLLIAVLYNTHTSTTIAFLVSLATLTVVFREPRFIVAGAAGFVGAIVLSGGYYIRVLGNHLHAARFWVRNVHLTRAHQIDDSPVLSQERQERQKRKNGTRSAKKPARGLYRSRLNVLVRLLGENPFIVAMMVTPPPQHIWGLYMYWWALAVLGWAVLTSFGGPLRILGPGYHYMKASVFPSAYALAVIVNVQEGAVSLPGLAVLLSLIASFAALAYFYRVMTTRRTEHTAHTPPDLAEAAAYLAGQPPGNVLVLPTMYADYVTFASGKPVLWGGHSGDLRKFEEFYPVVRRPLRYFFEQYAIEYILLDLQYVTPDRLGLSDAIQSSERFGAMIVGRVNFPAELEVVREPAEVR
jgi:hypothetical protein